MKVLLILADGMRPDALAGCADAQAVLKDSVYTLNAKTVMPSVTLPCHMSLFYSVDPSRHGTTTNTFAPQVRPIDGLCDVLKAQKKTSAFFYSWGELRDLCRPSSLNFSTFIKGISIGYDLANNKLTDAAIDLLNSTDIDFTFLYLGYPDNAGHSHGWMSEKYMEAIDNSWYNIRKILSALNDEYAVIITADHGGHDRTHGSSSPEDMTIPMIFTGAAKELALDLLNVSIMDIAPTVTALIGAEKDDEWEGKCLLG